MHDELYTWEVVIVCIHAFDRIQIKLYPKKQIPVIYLVYTRFRKADSIYQVYTRYIPSLNFLGFTDAPARAAACHAGFAPPRRTARLLVGTAQARSQSRPGGDAAAAPAATVTPLGDAAVATLRHG